MIPRSARAGRRSRTVWPSFTLAVALLGGCSPPLRTGVTVRVESDLGEALRVVEVRLGRAAVPAVDAAPALVRTRFEGSWLPAELGVTAPTQDDRGALFLRVRAVLADGSAFDTLAATAFVPGEQRSVLVYLANECRDPRLRASCETRGETCTLGGCRALDAPPAPGFDAGVPYDADPAPPPPDSAPSEDALAGDDASPDAPAPPDVRVPLDVPAPPPDVPAPPPDVPAPAPDAAAGCPSGTTRCGTACADLRTSASHCGACNSRCDAGLVCDGGSCRGACLGGQLLCGGGTTPQRCADPQSDAEHCGRCGVRCDAAQRCVAGVCTCPEGQTRCGDRCVDTQLSSLHCGACGMACSSPSRCELGRCVSTCSGGRTACERPPERSCVDLQTTSQHCGACTTSCAPEQRCVAGRCQCPAGTALCGARCVNLATSSLHCGACNRACTAGAYCAAGACACPPGQVLCGDRCVDTQRHPSHCGACGVACPAGSFCSAGRCGATCPECEVPGGASCTAATALDELRAGERRELSGELTPSAPERWFRVPLAASEASTAALVDNPGDALKLQLVDTCGGAALLCGDRPAGADAVTSYTFEYTARERRLDRATRPTALLLRVFSASPLGGARRYRLVLQN